MLHHQVHKQQPNEYVNSVFTMEQHQQQQQSPNHHIHSATNEINLRQIVTNTTATTSQQNLELNKTVPLGIAVIKDEDDEGTGCECIARKLGMDAQRLSKFYSVFLALLATVALTFSIYLVKLSHSLNASQMGTIKFATQLLCCLPFAYFYRQSLLGPAGSRRWLVARGLAGSLSLLAAYFSIKMINFADSMAIRYSSPILTALFARFLLKQKLHLVHALSLILSAFGVFFIIRPSSVFGLHGQSKTIESSTNFILGVSLAIVSAISAGSTFVFIKKLTQQSIHFVVIIFYYTLLGLILSVVVSLVLFFFSFNTTTTNSALTSPNGLKMAKSLVLNDISLAFLAGAISFVGHVSFTLAIARENANNIAILKTTDILLAFALDFFVSDLTPHPLTLAGAALILVSVVVIFAYKIYLHRRDRSSVYENNEVFRI